MKFTFVALFAFVAFVAMVIAWSNKSVTESFISSNNFIGAKKGYVFKNDSKGLGYYIDITLI